MRGDPEKVEMKSRRGEFNFKIFEGGQYVPYLPVVYSSRGLGKYGDEEEMVLTTGKKIVLVLD